jgi:trypsin
LNNPIGKTYKLSQIINNPNYNPNRITNDVSVLQTAEDIAFGSFVQPIALTDFEVDGDELAVLTGWGQLSNPGGVPNNLQIIQLRTITNEKCKATHGSSVYDGNICTFTKTGEGACMGDSGGPLVVDGKQAGVVSWGIACARGYPDVFTRVSYFRDWIRQNSGV